MRYLTTANAKTVKGEKKGYLTAILYLAPHRESGVMNVCPNASPGCIATCLFTAGRGVFPKVRQARIAKTLAFNRSPKLFVDQLVKEITSHVRTATRKSLIPVVRLNGTSDLPWEVIPGSDGKTLMETFKHVQFYDYTKSYDRAQAYAYREIKRNGKIRAAWPRNYHLTFSRSECNVGDAEYVVSSPTWANTAVVFGIKRGQPLPKSWGGYPVIDGDEHDLRFLDRKGCIVGLRAKGKARKDTTGFVITEGV